VFRARTKAQLLKVADVGIIEGAEDADQIASLGQQKGALVVVLVATVQSLQLGRRRPRRQRGDGVDQHALGGSGRGRGSRVD